MGDVRWDLLGQAPNPGQAFTQAFQQGQQQRQEQMAREAMAALVTNPNDPKALQAVARSNPQAAMEIQERQRQQAIQAIEQHRARIVLGAKIMRQVGVKDEASYQQALGMARQLGIDTSDVPPAYDPQYVNGLIQIADTLDPQKAQERIVTPQPGGGAGLVDANGNFRWIVQPNDGSAPETLSDEDILRLKGGQTGSTPSGGFL